MVYICYIYKYIFLLPKFIHLPQIKEFEKQICFSSVKSKFEPCLDISDKAVPQKRRKTKQD